MCPFLFPNQTQKFKYFLGLQVPRWCCSASPWIPPPLLLATFSLFSHESKEFSLSITKSIIEELSHMYSPKLNMTFFQAHLPGLTLHCRPVLEGICMCTTSGLLLEGVSLSHDHLSWITANKAPSWQVHRWCHLAQLSALKGDGIANLRGSISI